MNTFQNQYKFEPIGESRANAFLFIYVSVFRVCPQFANPSVFMLCGIISFAYANGFYSVYALMYSLYSVCVSQRFLFCLSPYLFSEWHIVPQLCIQIKQSRTRSRKALYE